jgi:hypothetical protein
MEQQGVVQDKAPRHDKTTSHEMKQQSEVK